MSCPGTCPHRQGDTETVPAPVTTRRTQLLPQWHVILLDDDEHSYDYVIIMLMDLFHHPVERAFQMAVTVDTEGEVVVDTTSRERAELKRDQIHSYGADPLIARCTGSMRARIEPVQRAMSGSAP